MDSEHFKRIFLPYHRKLYRIAYRFLENQADAEDMVQETYIKLWQKRLELESLINPESFAVTLLKNSCLDFLRKVKPDVSPLYEIAAAAMESPAEQVENREQLEHIQSIVNQLPAQQKQIVELKIWDNLSDEEIEQRTGLKQGNIKVIVSRARKTIKERYLKWEKNENR
ncbi:MAG: RNA polymerase sigma factor [Dysgonamonadaceae bacterium]|jgi:RNA polymerase sigma-70 factor (ECF subfamily)|nr:RNA polymerase sigma factor [Dysgonamonadaceae bacterium]